MDKKHTAPLAIVFKVLYVLLAITLLIVLATFLKNRDEQKPFNYYSLIPVVMVLIALVSRSVIGPLHKHHGNHKNKVKKVEAPEPEYRGGETFEADLDEQPAIA